MFAHAVGYFHLWGLMLVVIVYSSLLRLGFVGIALLEGMHPGAEELPLLAFFAGFGSLSNFLSQLAGYERTDAIRPRVVNLFVAIFKTSCETVPLLYLQTS